MANLKTVTPFPKKRSTLDVEGQKVFMDLLTLQGKDTACVQNVRRHTSNDILHTSEELGLHSHPCDSFKISISFSAMNMETGY